MKREFSKQLIKLVLTGSGKVVEDLLVGDLLWLKMTSQPGLSQPQN